MGMCKLLRDAGLDVLRALDAGTVKAALPETGEYGFCSVIEYTLDNGWKVGIFCDCGDWDYIEFMQSPEGQRLEYNDLYGHFDHENEAPWRAAQQSIAAVTDWDLPALARIWSWDKVSEKELRPEYNPYSERFGKFEHRPNLSEVPRGTISGKYIIWPVLFGRNRNK